eukprot:6214106-Pleurochrysis_carterae.AAC.2
MQEARRTNQESRVKSQEPRRWRHEEGLQTGDEPCACRVVVALRLVAGLRLGARLRRRRHRRAARRAAATAEHQPHEHQQRRRDQRRRYLELRPKREKYSFDQREACIRPERSMHSTREKHAFDE